MGFCSTTHLDYVSFTVYKVVFHSLFGELLSPSTMESLEGPVRHPTPYNSAREVSLSVQRNEPWETNDFFFVL